MSHITDISFVTTDQTVIYGFVKGQRVGLANFNQTAVYRELALLRAALNGDTDASEELDRLRAHGKPSLSRPFRDRRIEDITANDYSGDGWVAALGDNLKWLKLLAAVDGVRRIDVVGEHQFEIGLATRPRPALLMELLERTREYFPNAAVTSEHQIGESIMNPLTGAVALGFEVYA